MTYMIVVVEFVLSIKYNIDNSHFFIDRLNFYVVLAWATVYAFLVIYWLFLRLNKNATTEYPIKL